MTFTVKYKTIHSLNMKRLSDLLSDLQVQNAKFQNDHNTVSSKLTLINLKYKRLKRRFIRTEYSIIGANENLSDHEQHLNTLHHEYEIIRNISSVNYSDIKYNMYVDICMNHYAYLSYGIRSKGGKNVSNPYVVKKKLQTLETLESLANIISLKQHLVDDIQGYKNDIDTFKHTLYQVGTRKMILRRQYFKLCRKKRRVDKEIVNIQQRIVQTEILLNNEKCKLQSFLNMFTMS